MCFCLCVCTAVCDGYGGMFSEMIYLGNDFAIAHELKLLGAAGHGPIAIDVDDGRLCLRKLRRHFPIDHRAHLSECHHGSLDLPRLEYTVSQ